MAQKYSLKPKASVSEGDVNLSPQRAAWSAAHIDASTQDLLAQDAQYFLHQSLSSPCLNVLTHSNGIYLEDTQGRQIMDFHGNSVHQVGYGHPKVVDAINLNSTGCKEYEIEYVIDKSIVYPAAYVSFSFSSKAKNVSQSENVQPGDGKGSNGKDPWVGTKDLTFCGKAQQYINEYGDKAEAAATPVGKYKLIARLTFLKPKLLTVSSKEHVITVK